MTFVDALLHNSIPSVLTESVRRESAGNRVSEQDVSPNLLDLVLFSEREELSVTRFRDLKTEEYWNLAWPFLLTAVLGGILRYMSSQIWSPWYPCWLPIDFVHAVADALIIAGTLGILLELFATRLLIQKVSDDLAGRLVGRGLPTEVQSHIRTIVNTALVRDHFVKVYRLSPIAKSDKIQVDVTITFDVKNHSDAVFDYVPKFEEETFYEPQLLSLEYGLIDRPRHSGTSEDINEATKVKTVKATKTIKLEPVKRSEKAICQVAMHYTLKMPKEYTDLTNFAGATVGPVIRVENTPPGFEIVSAGETFTTEHPNGDKSWNFDRAFVTGQGVRVWWFQKKDQSSPASTDR